MRRERLRDGKLGARKELRTGPESQSRSSSQLHGAPEPGLPQHKGPGPAALPREEPPGRPPVAVGPPVTVGAVCGHLGLRSSPSAQHPEWVTITSVLPQAEPVMAKTTRPLSGLAHSASPLPLKDTGLRGRSWPADAHRPPGAQPASQAALVGGQCPATGRAAPEPLCSEGGASPAAPAAGRMAVASRHRGSRAGLTGACPAKVQSWGHSKRMPEPGLGDPRNHVPAADTPVSAVFSRWPSQSQ